jgi:circadian clock protein KaiB
MAMEKHDETTLAFERAAANMGSPDGKYILKLYITGMTPRSRAAVENVKRVLEENLADNYELEVIDVYQQPTLAKGEQIIAAPTLIKKLPLPIRRLIGDMSQTDRVLLGLDIKKKK